MKDDLFNPDDNKIVTSIGVSLAPTSYAVFCKTHGRVYLTYEEYNYQMNKSNELWHCPLCPALESAQFDDENWEEHMSQQQQREEREKE